VTVLRAERVGVVRGGKALLADVSVRATAGRLLAIVGPNGAGKSTLLGVLSGTTKPSSGTVALEGRALDAYEPRALARRRAILRQRFSVTSGFSVAQIVDLGRMPHGPRATDRALVERLLEEVGLQGFGSRAYATLSGGEQQRVHLARVLAQLEGPASESKLLLLDEPSSSLDPRHQHEVLASVRRRVAGGWSAIAVLHDLTLASRYAHDVVVLRSGRVVCDVPVAECDERTLAEVFGISVAITDATDGTPLWLVDGPAAAQQRK
jgi:iron complex transport system ATP-binding protein